MDNSINSDKSLIIERELGSNEQSNGTELDNERINQQLTGIRQTQHDDYLKMKNNINEIPEEVIKWPTETTLIAADSLCNPSR